MFLEQLSQHYLFVLDLFAEVIESAHKLAIYEDHWNGLPVVLFAQLLALFLPFGCCGFHVGVLSVVLFNQFLGALAIRAVVGTVDHDLHQK